MGGEVTEAVVGVWNHFEVDMRQNRRGKLDVSISGPGEPVINIYKRHNGIAVVRFFPSVSGKYQITVLVDGVHITGSPFNPAIGGESKRGTS